MELAGKVELRIGAVMEVDPTRRLADQLGALGPDVSTFTDAFDDEEPSNLPARRLSETGGNCGGSMSVDPRYCVGRDASGSRYCSASAIKVGDIVPLRVRVRNLANYETFDGEPAYVPGELLAGKTLQITFACLDGYKCEQPSSQVFEFDRFSPEAALEGTLSFDMGPAPGFQGVNHCDKADDQDLACGHITIEQNGRPRRALSACPVSRTRARSAQRQRRAPPPTAPLRLHCDGGVLVEISISLWLQRVLSCWHGCLILG